MTTPERSSMRPETFDSRDVGEVEEFVSRIYSKMRIGAVGENTRAVISRRILGPEVGFDDLDYSFDIGYAAEPPDLLIICDVVSNTIRRDGDRTHETFGPGDQFLISRPGLPYSGLAHGPRLRFTLLDPALLSRVAATNGAAIPVQVLNHRPVSVHAQMYLQRSIAYVRDNVKFTMDAPPAPLLVATAGQYLAASVLATYPNNVLAAAGPEHTRDAVLPNTVTRATTYIEANPDLDLTVLDIAEAAHITPRALQLAFRRHLDTTPMAYLRRVRLDHARDDLRAAAAGDGQTVTSVAARWGFTSSRFTQQYRAAYGEPPSNTLRN